MRILLDEQLDWRLAWTFSSGYDVASVRDKGWAGLSNGELLRAAEDEVDVLLTMDRKLPHQQNLRSFRLSVVILVAPSNRLADTHQLVPRVEDLLGVGVEPGRHYEVQPVQERE